MFPCNVRILDIVNSRNFIRTSDIALIEAIKIYGSRSWDKVADALPGRTRVQCRARYDRKIVTLYEGAWNDFVSSFL